MLPKGEIGDPGYIHEPGRTHGGQGALLRALAASESNTSKERLTEMAGTLPHSGISTREHQTPWL